MANSSFLMEADVDPGFVSEFSMKANSELALADDMIVDSDECLEKQVLDLFVTAGWTEFLSTSQEQREESPGGDEKKQTERFEIGADRVLVKNEETERLMEEKTDNRTEEEINEKKRGCHVRISLEEVESFYKFSCRCRWLCDEIMQLETNPPRAADISLDLRKQFAFLSGGRGDNGSPIIVFPEFPAFGEITDREFHNVLTYLTSVPSLSSTDVGFILVIDRRQDRWAAVKGTLLRIA
ncbi:hypothetical protein GOODEAATRI_016201, partial [Goodea atripinnis]